MLKRRRVGRQRRIGESDCLSKGLSYGQALSSTTDMVCPSGLRSAGPGMVGEKANLERVWSFRNGFDVTGSTSKSAKHTAEKRGEPTSLEAPRVQSKLPNLTVQIPSSVRCDVQHPLTGKKVRELPAIGCNLSALAYLLRALAKRHQALLVPELRAHLLRRPAMIDRAPTGAATTRTRTAPE